MIEVVVFSRPNCAYCQKAKDMLLAKYGDASDVVIFQIVLDEQADYDEARAEMVRLAGGKTTVPQVFIQGKFIPGGFTGLKQLDERGELDSLLKCTTESNRFDNRLGFKMSRLMQVQELDF
jgi:glutaredoxin 3